VVAQARDPGKLDAQDLEKNAWLSVMGPTSNAPSFEVSRGMQNILASMKKPGVRRIIISAGAGVADDI
jgi:hypothetical protein